MLLDALHFKSQAYSHIASVKKMQMCINKIFCLFFLASYKLLFNFTHKLDVMQLSQLKQKAKKGKVDTHTLIL